MEHNPHDWCVIYDTPTRFNVIDAESYAHTQELVRILPGRYHIPPAQLRSAQEKDIHYDQLGRLHYVVMTGVENYRYVYEDSTVEQYSGPSIREDPDYTTHQDLGR
jgi:hypothetical protein